MALLEIQGVSKSFGGVQALRQISLEVRRGEIHALCGENGAGKSTLIRVLSGVVLPDEGRATLEGKPLTLGSVPAAEAAGIAVIHQECVAFPHLNAADNIFAGRELTLLGGVLLDRKRMVRETQRLLNRLGEVLDPRKSVGEFSLAQRQMVAMARALSRCCKVLVLDEPTASLSSRETRVLFGLLGQMKRDGAGLIYVSHHLQEIFEIANRVSVLRDGELIATRPVSQFTRDELVSMMVGRSLAPGGRCQRIDPKGRKVVLAVRGLSRKGVFRRITFSVRAGEVVGFPGLVGAGRSEVARAIFGADSYDEGEVRMDGTPIPPGSIQAAIRGGIAMVPEDRQAQALVPSFSIGANLSLASLARWTHWAMIDRRREAAMVNRSIERLRVQTPHRTMPIETLSGGNQQKVVLGRWLGQDFKLLILDEPTRGIDVGTKEEIHRLIKKWAVEGRAIMMISSDFAEVVAVCHRALVMCQGGIRGELEGDAMTQESILKLALPVEMKPPNTP